MYKEVAKLILYADMDKDCVLYNLSHIFKEFEEGNYSKEISIVKALILMTYMRQRTF